MENNTLNTVDEIGLQFMGLWFERLISYISLLLYVLVWVCICATQLCLLRWEQASVLFEIW